MRRPCSYLFELDLRVDVDVADLAVEGFVLQARAFNSRRGTVLQLGSGSRVGLDGPRAAPGLQHCLVLRTCKDRCQKPPCMNNTASVSVQCATVEGGACHLYLVKLLRLLWPSQLFSTAF